MSEKLVLCKCGVEKTKRISSCGVIAFVCKPCHNKQNQDYKQRNKEKITSDRKAYYLKNRDKILSAGKEYRESENGKKIYEEYYARNCTTIKARTKRRKFVLGTEITNAETRRWAKINLDKRKQIRSSWKKRNKSKVNSDTATRFAKRQNATVQWANKFFIDETYDLAQVRSSVTGLRWEVDHLVPIRSELVCGLHCEHNLKVIMSSENMAKGNRWWPDMPDYTPQDKHELKYYKWLAENADLDNSPKL